MMLGGGHPYRRYNYRGYVLIVLHGGQTRITDRGDPDVICTEPSPADAERVVDGWCDAR